MRFGRNFGPRETHSNSTQDEECGGQPEKVGEDPWESREDEEEFNAFSF